MLRQGVSCLSFNCDGSLLAVAGMDKLRSLSVFAWKEAKFIASYPIPTYLQWQDQDADKGQVRQTLLSLSATARKARTAQQCPSCLEKTQI